MEFKALRLEDMEQVREWRNGCVESLRTPFVLTKEMQEDYYKNVICNRRSNARMWGIWDGNDFVGIAGLLNIEWENGIGEISIMLDPTKRRYGYGIKVMHELLRRGFEELRLENIYGECYYCNDAINFWKNLSQRYNAEIADLPFRKFFEGLYYSSMYFNINKENFYGANNT